MPRKRLFILSLAAVGLAGCNQHAARPAQPKKALIAAGWIGSRLPDFFVKDLQGRDISSADLSGKVVLIDFWATWCPPCKQEMPGYQNLVDRYGSRGFAVVGFKFDTMMDVEDPVLFANKIGVRYLLALAPDDLKQKFGGIEGLPTTMLYDLQGILRKKVMGFEYTNVIESELKPLLAVARYGDVSCAGGGRSWIGTARQSTDRSVCATTGKGNRPPTWPRLIASCSGVGGAGFVGRRRGRCGRSFCGAENW